jgi:hypothetical protein
VLWISILTVNCQIKAEEYETYVLAKENAEELEERLTALGYDVEATHCAMGNPQAHMKRSGHALLGRIAADDIDIVIWRAYEQITYNETPLKTDKVKVNIPAKGRRPEI